MLDPREWTLHEEDGLTSYCVPESERFLDWITGRGFLLHGSPSAVKGPLEPHIAWDSQRGTAARPAVYLTDVSVLAIFCALVDRPPGTIRIGDVSRQRSNDVITYERVWLKVGRKEQIRSHGYVYVVPREEASAEEAGEYLCYGKVQPSLVIRVSRSDLRYDIEVG